MLAFSNMIDREVDGSTLRLILLPDLFHHKSSTLAHILCLDISRLHNDTQYSNIASTAANLTSQNRPEDPVE